MLTSLLIAGLTLAAGSLAGADDKELVPMKLRQFTLKDVHLPTARCETAVETNRNYILSLDCAVLRPGD